MRRVVLAVFLCVLVCSGHPVSAHATLIQADPPPDAVLSEAPAQIRLWFSEPVEPAFSSIDVIDPTGQRLENLHSQVDAADPKLLIVAPGALSDGVYTISWRVTSAADGHPTTGSFPLTIGEAQAGRVLTQGSPTETLPPAGEVILRWLNLLLSALVIGGAGFWLFVWEAAAPVDLGLNTVRRRIGRLMWLAWAGLGMVIVLSLVQQAARASGISFGAALTSPALVRVVANSRFGAAWLIHAAAWFVIGLGIYWSSRRRAGWWLILVAGAVMLLATTLSSHSAGAPLPLPAMASDWLHLLAMALWVGGLVHFAAVLGLLQSVDIPRRTQLRAGLVMAFSNLGRVAIGALLITGLYAAYIEVGLGEGLTATAYGQVLLVKLILAMPLLGLAAINLLVTRRRLERAARSDALASAPDRAARLLRGLVAGEAALTVVVLLSVGILTATTPARSALMADAAAANIHPFESYSDMQMTEEKHVILIIEPGFAGVVDNYTIALYSMLTGEAIDDATLIRLQFSTTDVPGIARSELRLKPIGKGEYKATGSNMTLPGHWKIRAIIQRENAYDELVDFAVDAVAAPAPPSDVMSFPEHKAILLGLGVLNVLAGGVFFGLYHRRTGIGLLSALLLALGLVFVVSGILSA
jgi:copper transport protein